MVKFNKLPNSKSGFPHIENVDAYKYDNALDYGRYDYSQMELQICTVPWDMGEAHIGARTISGIGNVVHFGTTAKRDAWFNAISDDECYRFTTKYKELHRDGYIDVPIPFDMCAKHNYLVVRYNLFANDDSPVVYEGNNGMRSWFWFIREVEFLAPNTTRIHLLDDAFQTWIYDVNVSGMVLERGHAPMFAVSADTYLSNPVGQCENLLTEDVNFGEASVCKHIDVLGLNANTSYACIATTANPVGSWGTKSANTWKVPARSYNNSDGAPSVFVFAVAVGNLNTFLANVDSDVPQFKQTIQGVFFVSSDLVTTNGSFTFADTTCYYLVAGRKTFDLIDLDKSLFGYPTKYANIAKLYTSPYAHIEISDENGSVDVVKIEDTTGEIKVSAALSLAYPFINIDAHLMGVGGSASASVTYRNVDARTFNVSGQWYDTLRSWNVPTFAVIQDASVNYDYSSHFDRAQRVVDYTTAYDNESASATTAQSNANASASTAQSNANASATTAQSNVNDQADTLVSNATLTTTANSAKTARSNTSANTSSQITQNYNDGMAANANVITRDNATSTIAANEQQAAISAASGAASAAVGSIASAATGNIAGAVTGAVNGVIGAATTMASVTVGNALTAAQEANAELMNLATAYASNYQTRDDTANQTATATDLTTIENNLLSGTTANSAATQKSNATRDYNTATGNATRDYNTATGNATRDYNTAIANAGRTRAQAQSAITNDIAQAALNEPLQYGAFSSGESATTKPMALFAHIVTQNKSAIAGAGDEFLRYGYSLDRQWDFDGNWTPGKYFTYWKLRDFWVSGLNVPDMYMDKLRFFLFGGVTIWTKPEYIGKVTIYDNFS